MNLPTVIFKPVLSRRISAVALLLFFGATILRTANAEPLLLNDAEMDSVSAGYVSLYGNALAHATGEHVSTAQINVDIAQQKIVNIEEGLGYTVSTVTAAATALGEQVETAVSAGFDTNEQILSLDVQHSTVTQLVAAPAPGPFHHYKTGGQSAQHKPGQRKGHGHRKFHRRRPGAGKHRHVNPLIFQSESLTITLVTAQPLN